MKRSVVTEISQELTCSGFAAITLAASNASAQLASAISAVRSDNVMATTDLGIDDQKFGGERILLPLPTLFNIQISQKTLYCIEFLKEGSKEIHQTPSLKSRMPKFPKSISISDFQLLLPPIFTHPAET
jgi:hypothetical protein